MNIYSDHLTRKTIKAFDRFAYAHLRKSATRDSYLYEINSFCEFIGKDFTLQTEADCQLYLSYLENKISMGKLTNRTLKKKFSMLSSFSQFLLEEESQLPPNFLNFFEQTRLPIISESINEDDIISEDDFFKLLAYVKHESIEEHALLQVIYYGMLFISEALSLKYGDLAKDNHGAFGVRLTKVGDKERIAKIPEFVMESLLEVAALQPMTKHIFLSTRQNKPMSKVTASRHLKSFCEKAGLKKTYTFTQIRASSIQHAMQAGASNQEVVNQTGIRASKNLTKYRALTSVGPIDAAASDHLRNDKKEDKEQGYV